MELLNDTWVAELLTQIREDTLYYQLDLQMDKLRDRFAGLYRSLSQPEKNIMDAYLSLRSQMEACLTHTAYKIGFEHGKKRTKEE